MSIAKAPDNWELNYDLGFIYHHLGLDGAAEAAYHRAVKLDVRQSVAHNNLGCLYRALERWTEALACFEQAIERDSRNSSPVRNRGLLHLLRGELERAEQDIRAAIHVDPDHGGAKVLLGVYQVLSGELGAAHCTLRDGLNLYPEYSQYHRLYRTVYTVAVGQPEQGVADLQTILQEERPPAGLLRGVLEIARLLQHSPEPIPGLDQAVSLLETGRENAPVLEPKPTAMA